MKFRLAAWNLARVLAVLLPALGPAAQGATLLAEDDEWRYLKGRSEASSPDSTAWRAPAFNDAGWELGRGPFYYELNAGYVGNTELPDMNGGYTCLFLRRSFDVVNPAAMPPLTLDLRTDDGCVVWLNGTEVGRVNMPEGDPTYAWTSMPASGEPNLASFEISNPASLLRAGRNVLALQAFNSSLGGSSDFLIAVNLTSPLDLAAPQVIQTFPTAGATVRELSQIEVVFDEAVAGVDAADLRVNGGAATALEVFSPRNYAFHFAEPPTGRVQVAWISAHGIQDLAPTPNAFAGGSWTYTLDKSPRKANVIISEFLADNDGGVRDDFAERSDWIELLNLDAAAVNLGGWFLTDDVSRPTKWKFPAVNVAAGGYLLVWASERNLANPAAPLHTNFKLGTGGEYLALLDPQTNVVSAFAPVYPEQREDISFGRASGSPELTGYFPAPTPGGPNGESGPGFGPAPVFSVPSGCYTNLPLTVALSAPSGVIRYTLNGTMPTESSPAYSLPLQLTTSTVIQARVFEPGLLPGPVVVQAYTIAGNGMLDFGSNLPLMVIHTSGRGIPQDNRVPVCLSLFEPFRGRTMLSGPAAVVTKGQMEIRGQSSAGFPKVSYNLELNSPYGQDVELPLLDLPAESDWVLYAPYTDKPLVHNFLAYELHREMGHWSPRCRFVELFVDTSGRLDYGADYLGIYILMEKIKADNNRVDVERLSTWDNTEPDISGGYMFKKDKDSPGDRGFNTSGGGGFSGQYLKYHEPKPDEIIPAQETWLRNHLNRMEGALYASDWLTRTGTNHYSHYLDVDSFVDYHWIVEFAKQIDGYRLSNYMHKDRGGKVKMSPIWDWNLSFGNADYLEGEYTSGWYYALIGDNEHIWLRRLISGTPWSGGTQGDPDFNQRIADRWSELRTNILQSSRVQARIDELAAYLGEAQAREFKRWPRLGQYVWPNPSIYVTPTTYAGVVTAMKNWIRGRSTWIDGQFLVRPTLSHAGGGISPGFTLRMAGAAGTVYYTTDGSDPRARGGGVAPQAKPYSTEIVLHENSRVVARLRNGTRWSGPTAATFVVELPALQMTELMYRPRLLGVTDTNDPTSYEFVELRNAGSKTLDLRGFALVDGVQFSFATGAVVSLNPGARVVVAKDVRAFAQRYGAVAALAGQYTGSLANEGERLTLRGPHQETVATFRYEPGWQAATDGMGFALVADENAGTSDPENPGAWRTGTVRDGTPGQPEPAAPALVPVVINEVLSHTDPPLVGAIELYNPADQPADVSGWFLTDDRLTPKYRIPSGTVIAPQQYRVFTELDFNPTPGTPPSFSLRASGDEVYLLSADAAGKLTGYVHGFDFGAALEGVSFGRHITRTGGEQFVDQAVRSLGGPNAGPRVGPVVISEIMYHPADVAANGALWDNTEDEFVELTNLASTNVALFDPGAPTNAWRLRDAVSYVFPTNQFIGPGERVVIVGFDPVAQSGRAAEFRTKFGAPAGTRLFGPFEGRLANDRESVELVQPDVIRFYDTNTVVTAVLVDQVAYRDEHPWPAGADGLGFSLQRLHEREFGNDSANWVAALPSPGTGLSPGSLPVIARQPVDLDVRPGASAALSVLVWAGAAMEYQWRQNGTMLPGANAATLTLSNVQSTNAGIYDVIVTGAGWAVTSKPARLRVGYPPEILVQPTGIEASTGAEATFAVIAAGVSPLLYQWRKDGQPLPGASHAVLTLTSLESADSGTYDVVIRDDAGTTVSQPANLLVLTPPRIVQQPLSQTVPLGGSLALSVAVSPDANLPLVYYWTQNGVSVATHTLNAHVDLLTIPHAQATHAGQYRVSLRNPATPPGGIPSEIAEVQIVAAPDGDGDGMPDAFEQQFGLLPDSAADALADTDGDGATNREEYLAGTAPDDAESVLTLERVGWVGGAIQLRLRGQANRTYAAQYSDSGLGGPWRVLVAIPASSAIPYQSRSLEFTDSEPLTTGSRFYRVVTPGVTE